MANTAISGVNPAQPKLGKAIAHSNLEIGSGKKKGKIISRARIIIDARAAGAEAEREGTGRRFRKESIVRGRRFYIFRERWAKEKNRL